MENVNETSTGTSGTMGGIGTAGTRVDIPAMEKYAKYIKWAGKIGEYILFAGVAAIVMMLLFKSIFGGPNEIKNANKSVKQVQKSIDSLQKDQEFLLSRMYQLEQNQIMFNEAIGENNRLIKQNNSELNKLKKIYNEKIRSIDSYNHSQLDSFFSNRYGKYYNQ